jgi:hypothetical protein
MIETMMLRSCKNRRNKKDSDGGSNANNANDDDGDATYGFDETGQWKKHGNNKR